MYCLSASHQSHLECGNDRSGSGQLIYEFVTEFAGARPAWRDSCASRAVKGYICNIVTQAAGETDAFSCYDHIRVIEEHIGDSLFDVLLCNDNFRWQLNMGDQWVDIDDMTRLICPPISPISSMRVIHGDMIFEEAGKRADRDT